MPEDRASVPVFCSVCEHRWDMTDPGVRPAAGASPLDDSQWVCDDESACLERLAGLRERLKGGPCQQPTSTSATYPDHAPANGSAPGAGGPGTYRTRTARGTRGSTRTQGRDSD